MSRNPKAVPPEGAEAIVGDLRDRAALTRAVDGCTTVVAAAHGLEGGRGAGPDAIDARGNIALIDAASSAGVRRFVLVSTQGAAPTSPLSLMRAKYAAEQHLQASTLDWLIIRPAPYLETWLLLVVGEKVAAGGPAMILGKGNNPITFVSVRDVATAIAATVADRPSHTTLDITGPANYTLRELANATGATKIASVPRAALRLMQYAAIPVAPAFARKARMALHLDTAEVTTRLAQGTPPPIHTLANVATQRFAAPTR
jgi:NADH dehydrogenase